MHRQRNRGMTLLELMLATAILSVVAALSLVAMRSAAISTEMAQNKSVCMSNVRNVMAEMARELELAATEHRSSTIPATHAVEVKPGPGPTSPIQIIFQIPQDATGKRWTHFITYRFITEDVNRNGKLDEGEDKNNNDLLDRHILRIEQVQGGGRVERIMGGANDLHDVDFELFRDVRGVPRRVRITLTSSQPLPGMTMHESEGQIRNGVSAQVSRDVYFQN